MDLFIPAEDSRTELISELNQLFPGGPVCTRHSSLLETNLEMQPDGRLLHLVFCRQWLPNARPLQAESIRAWAAEVFGALAGVLPEDQPWSLHVEPSYGGKETHRLGARAWHSRMRLQASAPAPALPKRTPAGTSRPGEAGQHRCRLIREAVLELLQRKRRHWLRPLRCEPALFTPQDSLAQLLLTSPNSGFISVATAPLPFEQRFVLSPFPKGEVPMASDKTAPSRAFAKLVEAERRLGWAIESGEVCVDLGASPGSWSNVAIKRGARVLAVDRSPLREDLMANPQVKFQRGDAFGFEPKGPVDWLLCDVIAEPARTAELLVKWLRQGWCRYFVVTLKLKDAARQDVLTQLKRELAALTREFFLLRLCANKKEVCAFGERAVS